MASRLRDRLIFAAIVGLLPGVWSIVFAQTTPAVSSASGYRIAGIVVSKADGHRLARTRVILANVKDQKTTLSLVTGEDGAFAFSGLSAGKYSLLGAKRGFNTTHYEEHEQFWTAIVTGANVDTEHLILRLSPAAYVVGEILDENAEPVRRASVKLYVVSHDEGATRVVGNRATMTDDRGAYELGPLIPGTYYVSATAEPWYAIHPPKQPERVVKAEPAQVDPGLDVAYRVTYHGDTSDADSATPIQVRGGERVEADVHLAPVPSLHLLFHVPDGGANGTPIPQLWESGFGEDIGVSGIQPRMVSPGLWELSGVPQGNYKVGIFGGANPQEFRTTELSATTDGEEIDTSDAEALSTVKVSVQLPGEKSVPTTLVVALRIPKGNVKSWSNVDAKGEAQLQQVVPGRYEVVSWNMGRTYGIVNLTGEGCDLSGRVVTIGAGSSASISLTLAAGVGVVEGGVKRNGKPLAGAMVVLVPNDPAEHLDLFRRDQSDLDGTFALKNVVPGTYTILAIEDGWEIDWSRPEVIAPYLRRGQTISVGGQANGNIKVAEAVEAQPKM